jgi:hypothetical protein
LPILFADMNLPIVRIHPVTAHQHRTVIALLPFPLGEPRQQRDIQLHRQRDQRLYRRIIQRQRVAATVTASQRTFRQYQQFRAARFRLFGPVPNLCQIDINIVLRAKLRHRNTGSFAVGQWITSV